jgi:hypothetical protein
MFQVKRGCLASPRYRWLVGEVPLQRATVDRSAVSLDPTTRRALVDTRRFASGLCERMGFALIPQTPDGIALGSDYREREFMMPLK